jgi:NADH-quinone oxidoreductase subunit G
VKEADTIRFNSRITNEEAYILQKLKEELGIVLVNEDAFRYKKFLERYSKISGKSLYSGDLKEIRKSNFVISVGSMLRTDSPNSRYALNNSMKMNKGAGIYFHPIGDNVVASMNKNLIVVQYNPSEEVEALKWILKYFGKELPEKVARFVENVSLQLPEDFEAKLEKALKKKDRFGLIVGSDLYTAPNSETLAELVGLIDRYTDFSVVIIPSDTNTLGVSLICDVQGEDSIKGKIVGYNEKGKFVISSTGSGDFPVPALNQQEGTFVNIDKRVVPINPALHFDGYCLNDIANGILKKKKRWTIDYTAEIFKKVEFDELPNEFLNNEEENRGYVLDIEELPTEEPELAMKDFDLPKGEEFIYLANPVLQFSPLTNMTHNLKTEGRFYISPELAEKYQLSNNDEVEISNINGALKVKVEVDKTISGEYGYLPTFDLKLNSQKLFNGYRFTKANIRKV